jgi:hypothetical protein
MRIWSQVFPEMTFAECHKASSRGRNPYEITFRGISRRQDITKQATKIGVIDRLMFFIISL